MMEAKIGSSPSTAGVNVCGICVTLNKSADKYFWQRLGVIIFCARSRGNGFG